MIDVRVLRSLALFLTAGLLEIGGGYLVWLWLCERQPLWMGLLGGLCLCAYGVVCPCFSPLTSGGYTRPTAGCSWSCRCSGAGDWTVIGPDVWDVAGALLCLLGVMVLMYAPRGND
jgi:small multidrug resistance family-3 protein